jgi:hypothetical protein
MVASTHGTCPPIFRWLTDHRRSALFMMIFTNQDPSWLRAPVGHVILSASEGSHLPNSLAEPADEILRWRSG